MEGKMVTSKKLKIGTIFNRVRYQYKMKNKISRRKAIGTSLKASLGALGAYDLTTNTRKETTIIPQSSNTLPLRISLNTPPLLKHSYEKTFNIVQKALSNTI